MIPTEQMRTEELTPGHTIKHMAHGVTQAGWFSQPLFFTDAQIRTKFLFTNFSLKKLRQWCGNLFKYL